MRITDPDDRGATLQEITSGIAGRIDRMIEGQEIGYVLIMTTPASDGILSASTSNLQKSLALEVLTDLAAELVIESTHDDSKDGKPPDNMH